MFKKTFSVIVLALMFRASNADGQANDLQHIVHEKVRYGVSYDPKDEYWIKEKQALAGYTPEDIVHALIVETDVDRGNRIANRFRDIAASELIKALNLPVASVCQELDKPQPPQRKASLMMMLGDVKTPETMQALLRQISDRRPGAQEPGGTADGFKLNSLRVCDVAFNILANNLGLPSPQRARMMLSDSRRDEIIRQTLADQKLKIPE